MCASISVECRPLYGSRFLEWLAAHSNAGIWRVSEGFHSAVVIMSVGVLYRTLWNAIIGYLVYRY